MATQVKIKRRTADATAPSGLTAGEMAINLVDKKLYVGGTAGTNVIFLDSTSSVGLGTANTFTQLNTFSAGISASGGTFGTPTQLVGTNITGTAIGFTASNVTTNANLTGHITSTGNAAVLGSFTSAALRTALTDETGTGVAVFQKEPTFDTSVVGSATMAVFNTASTTVNGFGAATTMTLGATTGNAYVRNPTLTLGNTTNTIATNTSDTNHLTIAPSGNLVLTPQRSTFLDGDIPVLTITNTDFATGQVQIEGGDLFLGNKSDGFNTSSVNIIFEGLIADASETTLTIAEPTADRTITLPDASGTVALTATSVASFNGFTGGITFAAGTGITFTASAGTITLSTTAGAVGATGATGPTGSQGIQGVTGPVGDYVVSFNGLTGAVTGITAGGVNTFTQLNTFSAGISASDATFTGLISGATATFSKDIRVNSMTVGLGGSSDTNNVAIGDQALVSNTSDYPNSSQGSYNTAIGAYALTSNTIGENNTAFGNGALASNSSGGSNIAIGYAALVNVSTASYNIAIGTNSLWSSTLGNYNIGIGFETLGAAGNTGNSNVAVGYQSLKANTTGSNNTGIGTSALLPLTTGSRMTALGHNAGRYRGTATTNVLTGTGGIYIGYQARASAGAQTNEIVIGVDALGLGSNTAVIGATLQSAATIYGLLNLPSGLSASGATFMGNISAPNIVTSFNGATGDIIVAGLDFVLFNLGII